MNKKIITISLMLIALFFTAVTPAFAQEPGDQVLFGQNFTLESEKTQEGNLVILGGNATLENSSTVDGDIAIFGGNLTANENSTIDGDMVVFGGFVQIDGTVTGDVGAVGGNITLSETAVVEGDIGSLGGMVDIAEGAAVKGEVGSLDGSKFSPDRFQNDVNDYSFEEFDGFPPGSDSYYEHRGPSFFGWIGAAFGDIFWNIALLVILGVITWMVAAFMPDQMYTVRQTLTTSAPLSFGLGLLTSIAAAVLTPVAVFLLITICLAIVPILGYIILGIATLFGWIVIGQILGERLLVASGRSQPGLIFSSIVGVSILTLLANLPVIGLIDCIGFIGKFIGALVAMAGLGAVLLTRFGTRPYPAAPPSYGGGGSPGPSSYTGSGLSGSRVRWTEPAPDVSEEEVAASEAELNAKIKAALAEADEIAAAKAKAGEVLGKEEAKAEAEEKDDESLADNEKAKEKKPKKRSGKAKKSDDEVDKEPESDV